jgi:hypothetical protein
MTTTLQTAPHWGSQLITGVLLLGAGYVCGLANGGAEMAQAEPRKLPPREAFLSGSERSEVVLQDIKGILERIDGRLQRFEKAQAVPVPPAVRPLP